MHRGQAIHVQVPENTVNYNLMREPRIEPIAKSKTTWEENKNRLMAKMSSK